MRVPVNTGVPLCRCGSRVIACLTTVGMSGLHGNSTLIPGSEQTGHAGSDTWFTCCVRFPPRPGPREAIGLRAWHQQRDLLDRARPPSGAIAWRGDCRGPADTRDDAAPDAG